MSKQPPTSDAPHVVCFMPLRGGSKSIPGKNIKVVAGKPLCHWGLEAAIAARGIDRVVVSTDDDQIAASVAALNSPKLVIHRRSAASANDTAPTEQVMLEYAEANEFENLILLQATSPLVRAEDLDSGIELFARGQHASVLSVVRQKRFVWAAQNGVATPKNYSPDARPRRQDFDGFLVENGAFYICSRASLLRSKSRLATPVGTIEMPAASYVEIDEPEDWLVLETLLRHHRVYPGLRDQKIRLVASDVDGVLTDAGMYYGEGGDEQKKFNTRDGMGFKLLRDAGLATALVTTENTQIVARRAAKLKIAHVAQGTWDKVGAMESMCSELGIDLSQVAYIGDDVNCRPLLEKVGFAACPADAVTDVKDVVDFVCTARGGGGAFREMAELVLAAHRDL